MKKCLTLTIAMLALFILPMCTGPKNVDKTKTEVTTTPTEVDKPQGFAEKGIDTARDEDYLTTEEKDMIKEINLMRSDPVGYISYIEVYIKEQQDELKTNQLASKSQIDEEVKTARELIRELRNTPKLSILKPHRGVFKAAKKHGQDIKSTGNFGHVGSDGSMPWDRILKASPDLKDGNENLVGGIDNVRNSVIVLLVDSGIQGRGHRKTLLEPKWEFVACYKAGKVSLYPNTWVQNFGSPK